jgi:hypothetical protein
MHKKFLISIVAVAVALAGLTTASELGFASAGSAAIVADSQGGGGGSWP